MLVGRLYQPQLLQLWRSNCSLERFTAAVFLRMKSFRELELYGVVNSGPGANENIVRCACDRHAIAGKLIMNC